MRNLLTLTTALSTGALALMVAVAPSARAQTVINLTNLDSSLVGVPTLGGAVGSTSDTVLGNVNVGDALSNGGLFGGAANILDQRSYNQLNAMGVTAPGVVTPVVLGTVAGFPGGNPTTVEINMLTSAAGLGTGASTLSGATSLTSLNTNTANVARPNVIPSAGVGASLLLGYSAGPASVGGSQVGINSANALGAAFAPGTTVSLNQMPIGLGINGTSPGLPTTTGGQQGFLNMSSVNNLVAFTAQGSSEVNGSATGVDANGNPITVAGSQIAQNRFNTAAVYGDVALVLGQKADGLNGLETRFTSANTAAAYSANLGSAGIDPTVRNLNQGAGVDINTLALAPVGGTSGAVTLSGQQSITGSGSWTGTPLSGTVGTVIPVVTNQMVASTVGTTLAALAATQPAPGVAGPIGGGALALAPRDFVNNAPAAADVGLSNVGQTIATAYNRVDAGNMAITALPATGSGNGTGFSQVAGEIGAISSVITATGLVAGSTAPVPGAPIFSARALNNAQADTVAGRASIDGLAQNYQMTANTLNSGATVTGGFTQTANALNFGAGQAAPAGYGALQGGVGSAGSGGSAFAAGGQPYEVALTGLSSNLMTNSAYAGNLLGGNASVNGTTQRTNVLANVLSTSAALTTTSAGAVEQNLGAIAGYGGTTPMQAISAVSGNNAGSGLASATGYRQDIGLTGNLVSSAGLSGTVTQQGPTMYSDGTVNLARAVAAGRGDATIGSALLSGTGATSGIQTTALTMNRIDSTGTIGSAATPAALSQSSGGVNLGSNLAFNGASNVAAVAALGSSGNAVGNNLVQQASVNFNSLASTGLLVGNANQTSNGFLSANGNQATANTAGCGSLCNGTGNATLLGTQQVVGQTLNTMALAGGATGLLNQVAAGNTDLLSRNTVRTQSATGYAINTGVQVATNGVNVISAAR